MKAKYTGRADRRAGITLTCMIAAAPPQGLAAFEPFTLIHVAVVVVAVALVAWLLRTGRRWRRDRPGAEHRLRVIGAIGIVGAQIVSNIYWLAPARYDAAQSLPIHVCDLIPWCAAAALLWPTARGRWARALTFFWGLGLSGWAFLWPVVTHGPATWYFWLFWTVHLQIVAAALYLPLVHDWRPDWRDFRFASLAAILYAVLITPLNATLPADYGYVGPGDGPARLLGPWPWRIPVVVAGEILIFAALLLPWRLGRTDRST